MAEIVRNRTNLQCELRFASETSIIGDVSPFEFNDVSNNKLSRLIGDKISTISIYLFIYRMPFHGEYSLLFIKTTHWQILLRYFSSESAHCDVEDNQQKQEKKE